MKVPRPSGGTDPDKGLERPSLGARPGWRRVTRVLIKSLFIVTAITAIYFVVPLDSFLDGHQLAQLVIGIAVFILIVVWQVRNILGARFPTLQAIEAFALSIPCFLFIFSIIYYELAQNRGVAFTQHLSRLDALYFTVTVFSTVGFGDIAPVSETARVVATFQMLADLAVLGILIKSVTGAVRLTRSHRGEAPLTD